MGHNLGMSIDDPRRWLYMVKFCHAYSTRDTVDPPRIVYLFECAPRTSFSLYYFYWTKYLLLLLNYVRYRCSATISTRAHAPIAGVLLLYPYQAYA